MFTNDYWKAVIHISLAAYEEAVEILNHDLAEIQELAQFSSLMEEVTHVQQALHSLEGKLSNLKLFLPKPSRKRGLINAAGSLLQFLFGTALDTDVSSLHSTIAEVSQKQGEVIHVLNQHVTYFKQLDSMVRIDHMALANWSSIVKDFIDKSQIKFQKTVTRLEWMSHLQNATTAVRNLEFALMQLELQLDEVLSALQTLVAGRAPFSLLDVHTFQRILNNISLSLPPGYDLLVGNHLNMIPWYYRHVQATLLADYHGFILVLSLPLTMSNRNYEIYEIVTFPAQVVNQTYARYQLGKIYLAVSSPHFTYLTLSENELNSCEGDGIKYCSADKAVSSSRTDSCPILLYLRSSRVHDACPRVISAAKPTPRMERRGTSVMFFLPEPTDVVCKCRYRGPEWNTSTLQLQGAGFLHDVARCHITAGSLQLFAEVRGQTDFEGNAPLVVYPSPITVTTDSELESLKNLSDNNNLNELITQLSAHHMETSVDALLQLKPLSPLPTSHSHWSIPLLITTSTTLTMAILYFCLREHWVTILKCCTQNTPAITVTNIPTDNTRSRDQRPDPSTSASYDTQSTRPLNYSTYALDQLPPA
jgi:hypothetical protein